MLDELLIKTENKGEHTAILAQVTGSGDIEELQSKADANGYSLPKQILVDAVKEQIITGAKEPEGGFRGYIDDSGYDFSIYDYVLSLSLPCGGKVDYKTFDDIPNESVPCPCGNPEHWLIRYEDLRR